MKLNFTYCFIWSIVQFQQDKQPLMLYNPLKNPLREDKMGTFVFKSKRVRKGSFSNLFSFSVLLLSLILVSGCSSSDDGGSSSTTSDTGTTDTGTTTTTLASNDND